MNKYEGDDVDMETVFGPSYEMDIFHGGIIETD